jgi:hypothetical protein
MFLLSILLGGLACKKDSKINPACQEDKLVPTIFYGLSCDYIFVRVIDNTGQTKYSGQVEVSSVPKKYRPKSDDSLVVRIAYDEKHPICTQPVGFCGCVTLRIKCVQSNNP